MIKVARGSEPAALSTARAARITNALVHALAASPDLSDVLRGYDVSPVKEELFAAQHKKCAYCERRRDFSSSPIEHFRPKNSAWRNLPGEPRQVSRGHYWWLTWTWENLLFACPRCNYQGHKANYFPLESGTVELQPPAPPLVPLARFNVSGEKPLLLDPAVDVFLDHIEWVPSDTHLARKLWRWTPTHHSERGRATIAILKLTELADEVERHLIDHVLPRLVEVEQHIQRRRTQQAATCWGSLLDLLHPEKDFTAATWCALSRWVKLDWLAEWKLAVPPRPL